MEGIATKIDKFNQVNDSEKFTLDTKNVKSIFTQLYRIPFYQRPYDWENKDIENFIKDIFEQALVYDETPSSHTISNKFIGTIVLTPSSLRPNKVSTTINDIVDGQQRITTLQLILVSLHKYGLSLEDELKRVSKKLQKIEDNDNEKLNELIFMFNEKLQIISKSIIQAISDKIERNSHRAVVDFIPRLIREDGDTWGSEIRAEKENLTYVSSPTLYIFNYLLENITKITHSDMYSSNEIPSSDSKFSLLSKDLESFKDKSESYKVLEKKAKNIDDFIRKIFKSHIKLSNQEMPLIFDENEHEIIGEKGIASFKVIYYFIIFSFYLLNKVNAVIVKANSESEAFDIFDSLNTTGEPLNAIQVLNALVVGFESFQENKYLNSVSKEHMDVINKFINGITELKDRNTVIFDLLNAFSLLITGKSLANKSLSTQIDFVKEHYNRSNDSKVFFIKLLADLTVFFDEVWVNKTNQYWSDNLEMKLLISTGHTVTIPILAYYYKFYKEEINSFNKILKAIMSFSVLRRVGLGGTAGIEKIYKELFSAERPLNFKKIFNQDFTDYAGVINIEYIQNEFLKDLNSSLKSEKENITLRSRFLRNAMNNDFYSLGRNARYFLLCCYELTIASGNNEPPLLLKSERKAKPTLMTVGNFDLEIEHIAPQTQSEGWGEDIYSNHMLNKIGNTTLLPKLENIERSNQSFSATIELYKLYSMPDDASFKNQLELLLAKNILKLKKNGKPTFNKVTVHTVAHLLNIKVWDEENVKIHSKELLKFGWNYLIVNLSKDEKYLFEIDKIEIE